MVAQQELSTSGEVKPRTWLVASAVWLLVWAAINFDGIASAMSVWFINDTYNHGFFILPGALYMIWQQRGAILEQHTQVSLLGVLGVAGLLFIFALGQAAYINVLQHTAIFAFVPTMVLMLFGFAVVRKIAFPLAFMLFSIPVGEELIPLFQDITAAISMFLLKLVNIPAYREGLYISIPGGQFIVAEACSGVRFFIACVVLGSVYGYLNFISLWRVIGFGIFSIVLPIVANGIRAFGIMYVGYISDMQHAVDADHLIYGWFFFSLVVIVLILVGRLVSDGKRVWHDNIGQVDPSWSRRWTPSFAIAAFAPLLLMYLMQVVVKNQNQGEPFLLESNELRLISEDFSHEQDWMPRFYHADEYRSTGGFGSAAKIYQAIYNHNVKDEELVSWENRIYDQNLWSLQGQYIQSVDDIKNVNVLELTTINGRKRLVAYWYIVQNRVSSNRNMVKLQQALNTLLLLPGGGAVVVVSLEYSSDQQAAREQLLDFIGKTCNMTKVAYRSSDR